MHWHQERQRLLSENVANADTPNYRSRDLAPYNPDPSVKAPGQQLAMARTQPGHVAGAGGGTSQFAADRRGVHEVRPVGNAVTLEDEMLKVASNQMDYQAATSLYSRSLGLFKTALGKR